MAGPYKGYSTECTCKPEYAHPRNQPSDRDQKAQERLQVKVSGFKAKFHGPAHITLGPATQNIIHKTFDLRFPVLFHFLTITKDSLPLLNVVEQGRHCISSSDFYFMNIKPKPIIIPTHQENNSPPTGDHVAARDPTYTKSDPLQPGETHLYSWMLSSSEVPILDLTDTKVTCMNDIKKAFHTLNLCEEHREDLNGRQDTTTTK